MSKRERGKRERARARATRVARENARLADGFADMHPMDDPESYEFSAGSEFVFREHARFRHDPDPAPARRAPRS